MYSILVHDEKIIFNSKFGGIWYLKMKWFVEMKDILKKENFIVTPNSIRKQLWNTVISICYIS